MSRSILLVLTGFLLSTVSYQQNLKNININSKSILNELLEKYGKITELSDMTFIGQEIDIEYSKLFQEYFQIHHFKENLDKINVPKKDTEVFNGLNKTFELNMPDVEDMIFFNKDNRLEQWFVTTMNSTGVFVFQTNRDKLVKVVSHTKRLTNSSKIHVVKFEGRIFLIVQESQCITVLYLFKQDGKHAIREISNIVTPVKYLSTWQWMGQLFMGILSPDKLHLYTLTQDSFSHAKSLPFSAGFFTILQPANTSSSYLIGSDHVTAILEQRGHSFVHSRTIRRGFQDGAALHTPNGDFFLALVSSNGSIVYRRSRTGDFEPFQKIGPAARIVAGMGLLMLLKEGGIVAVYQYEGRKFARVNMKLLGVERAKLLELDGEEQLLLEWLDRTWSLNRIKWTTKTTVQSMNDAKQWCSNAKKKAGTILELATETKRPIRIRNRRIQKLKVNSVNGLSLKNLQNLTDRSAQLLGRLTVANETLDEAKLTKDPRFIFLRAQKARLKCSERCSVKNLAAKLPCDISASARKIGSDQDLSFDHVKVDRLEGLPLIMDELPVKMCPSGGVKLMDVRVKGSINGIPFDDLQKDVLKKSGDQVVTGQHVFEDLRVDSFAARNLDLASNETRQRIAANRIHATELILTEGGMLLPLNGEPTTMTGTLRVSKVKFDGLVDLHSGIKGANIERFKSMVIFPGSQRLQGNYTLRNVRIERSLKTGSVLKNGEGRTLEEIAEGAVPLDVDVMPVRLELEQNRTIWSNVTAPSLPRWLCRNNSEIVKVTGKKIARKSVTLADSIISKLPPPKIRANLCSNVVETSDLKISSIRINKATARVVESDYVNGAKRLESAMLDSVTSLEEVDLSEKDFTGFLHVEHLNISYITNSPFYSFKQAKFRWYNPDTIEGPIKMKSLQVGSLNAPKSIKIPPPSEIRNMIVEGNLQVKTINGIIFDDFLKNFVRIDDAVSLKNVEFAGNLEIEEIVTENTNVDLKGTEQNIYLGNKTISGDFEVEGNLFIPNILSYPPEDDVDSYVVEGSIRFLFEPDVESVNTKKLSKLFSEIWMNDRPSDLTGLLIMKNVTLSESYDFFNSLHTPKFGPLNTLGNRLLSKTKWQEIKFPVHFKDAKIPNIMSRGDSTLYSSDRYLNDLLYMTLKKNDNQIVQDNWRFDTMIVKDGLSLHGKINNLNLSSDVARHDVTINKVTGKKIIDELTVRNLSGLNFGNSIKDALVPSETDKTIVISGEKTFDSISARILNVTGKVMGKNLSECLLKTGDQIITAPKILKGSLHVPSLLINGLINDVNLTDFKNYQMRSLLPEQRVKSKMLFKNNIGILGDLKIEGKYQDVDLKKLNEINEIFAPAVHAISYLKSFATGIETLIKNGAKYWDKFEYIKEDILLTNSMPTLRVNFTLHFHNLGDCCVISLSELECDHQNRFDLKPITNTTEVLINQMLSVDDEPIVVQVTSGSRSRITIYEYDYLTNSFYTARNVRAPGIFQASVLTDNHGVWIALRLKAEMMLVRFEIWGDLRKYHLPDSRFFALDRVPVTDEPILVREDGMWKLDGLAGPRHWFKVALRADRIETFTAGKEFFVRLICKSNGSRLLRAKYVGTD